MNFYESLTVDAPTHVANAATSAERDESPASLRSQAIRGVLTALLVGLALLLVSWVERLQAAELAAPQGQPWKRHTINDQYAGPDGTRLADVDGDGLLDVTTGFESAGVTTVLFHPGKNRVREPWLTAAVGKTPKAEDAVFVDLDRDGALDVVTSSEQEVEQIFVHWGPGDVKQVHAPSAWSQASVEPVQGVSQWMFAEPIRVAPDAPVSLAIGGKNYNRDQTAKLGLLTPGKNPRQTSDYQWRPLTNVSWVMSIIAADVDGDGLQDVIYSDKHGPGAGVWWLRNPGADGVEWTRRPLISDRVQGCMFIALGDVDGDGLQDVVAPIDFPRQPNAADHEHRRLVVARRLDGSGTKWEQHEVAVPPGVGQPKAVTIGDVNGDGRQELVVTSTGAEGYLIGTYWLEYEKSPWEENWRAHNIAGAPGIKYDLVHLVDLDGDGDLDVLTNEEKEPRPGDPETKHGLGVFWYENELRPIPATQAGG